MSAPLRQSRKQGEMTWLHDLSELHHSLPMLNGAATIRVWPGSERCRTPPCLFAFGLDVRAVASPYCLAPWAWLGSTLLWHTIGSRNAALFLFFFQFFFFLLILSPGVEKRTRVSRAKNVRNSFEAVLCKMYGNRCTAPLERS